MFAGGVPDGVAVEEGTNSEVVPALPKGVEGTLRDTDFSWTLSRLPTDCREARRLIARRDSMSPRLKDPAPCLNSH